MKTWRETRLGKGVKRPKVKQMKGLYNKQDWMSEIKRRKAKQAKLLRVIREELKKLNQLHLSQDGLKRLSDSSIQSIQTRREKSILKINDSVNQLSKTIRDLKTTENRFRRAFSD